MLFCKTVLSASLNIECLIRVFGK